MTTQHSRLKRIASTLTILTEASVKLSCVQLGDALLWILEGTTKTSDIKLAPSNTWDTAYDREQAPTQRTLCLQCHLGALCATAGLV
jgi:hypothetical protein